MATASGISEGDWDGMPMTFLMRQVVEKTGTVDEALTIMFSLGNRAVVLSQRLNATETTKQKGSYDEKRKDVPNRNTA